MIGTVAACGLTAVVCVAALWPWLDRDRGSPAQDDRRESLGQLDPEQRALVEDFLRQPFGSHGPGSSCCPTDPPLRPEQVEARLLSDSERISALADDAVSLDVKNEIMNLLRFSETGATAVVAYAQQCLYQLATDPDRDLETSWAMQHLGMILRDSDDHTLRREAFQLLTTAWTMPEAGSSTRRETIWALAGDPHRSGWGYVQSALDQYLIIGHEYVDVLLRIVDMTGATEYRPQVTELTRSADRQIARLARRVLASLDEDDAAVDHQP